MFKHSVQIYCLLYVGNADKADNTPWSSHADCYVKRCAIAYALVRSIASASAWSGTISLPLLHSIGAEAFTTTAWRSA